MAEISFSERIKSVPGWDQLLRSWGQPTRESFTSAIGWDFLRAISSQEVDNQAVLKRSCLIIPPTFNRQVVAFVASAPKGPRVIASNLTHQLTQEIINHPSIKPIISRSGHHFIGWRKEVMLPRIGRVFSLSFDEVVNYEDEVISLLTIGSHPIKTSDKEFLRLTATIIGWRFCAAIAKQQSTHIQTRFATLTSHLSEGLAVVSPQGTLTLWNRYFYRLTAVRSEQIVGLTVPQIIEKHQHLDWLRTICDKIYSPGAPTTIFEEVEYTRTSGTIRWLAIAASRITDQAGNIEQIMVLARDISHKKNLEKRKSEFISMATHELRTPLTAVMGYLSLMARDQHDLPPRHQVFLERAERASKRLLCLAEDLLHTNQIEEDRLSINWQSVNLAAVLEKITNDLRKRFIEKGLRLRLSAPFDRAIIWADERRIEQIVSNLTENGLKYTNKGGVDLDLKQYRERSGKQFWQIVVKDTGIGIPASQLGHIFDRFHRAHTPEQTQEQGAGLGLFIVKYLVTLFSGQIKVKSRAGKGTTFSINFPRYQNEQEDKNAPVKNGPRTE